MSKWKETPFETLDSAYRVASSMGMHPRHIEVVGDFRCFKVYKRKKVTTVAQRADGTGPVLEKVEPIAKAKELPKYRRQNFGTIVDNEPKQKQDLLDDPTPGRPNKWWVRPWLVSPRHKTIAEAKEYYQRTLKDQETLATFDLCIIRFGNIEYHLCETEQGLITRSMQKFTVKNLIAKMQKVQKLLDADLASKSAGYSPPV